MLRIALISDIHGNGVALDAVLDEIGRDDVDRVVCLGDAIQGGSQPLRVVQRLQDLGCPVVMGNADHYVLTGESAEPLTAAHAEVREWTRAQIGDAGLDFVAGFVPTLGAELPGGRTLLCFHGSPRSFDEVLAPDTSDEEWSDALRGTDAVLLAGGHTHMQWSRSLGVRAYLNPGSVGLAYNRLLPPERFHVYPLAEYARVTVTESDVSLEFRHVLIDADELASAARASGRPHAENEARRYRPRGRD